MDSSPLRTWKIIVNVFLCSPPLQTQSQEISQMLIFHKVAWLAQARGEGALVAASARNRARGCYFCSSSVWAWLCCPSSFPRAAVLLPVAWLTGHRWHSQLRVSPADGQSQGINMQYLGGMLRYTMRLMIWEQGPGFCKQPGNTCRQGSFFSEKQEHLWARHKRGEGESSPPCPPNACCCRWLPVVLIHLTKLGQNLG